jgi:hypothetical protein
MTSTSREEEALAVLSNPLKYDGILQQVFAFIPGHWLFLSAVCSEWRAIYANIGEQQVISIDLHQVNKLVTYDCRTTLYSAAVASPAIVRLAQSCGMKICTSYRVSVIAGLHADAAR